MVAGERILSLWKVVEGLGETTAVAALIVFLLGMVGGSFLNVVIHRLPRRESVVSPPSHCPGCGRRLGALELVPVVSFLAQGGRCRGCGQQISWRYPLVELLGGVLLLGVYARYPDPALVAFYGLFVGMLLAAAFIDLAHQIIPNRLLAAGLAGGAALFPFARPMPLWAAAAGLALAGTVMLVLALASRGGMGGGDVKLAAVAGFFLGPGPVLLALFLAFAAGGAAGLVMLLTKRKGRKDFIPFGPYIALGSAVASLWGRPILQWYAGRL